jgi:hypothetical protein
MATKSPESILDKMPAGLRKKFMKCIADALEMHNSLEMSNIPKDCWESAAASWLAAERKLMCWVHVPIPKGKSFMYDLRPGHEAEEKTGS